MKNKIILSIIVINMIMTMFLLFKVQNCPTTKNPLPHFLQASEKLQKAYLNNFLNNSGFSTNKILRIEANIFTA